MSGNINRNNSGSTSSLPPPIRSSTSRFPLAPYTHHFWENPRVCLYNGERNGNHLMPSFSVVSNAHKVTKEWWATLPVILAPCLLRCKFSGYPVLILHPKETWVVPQSLLPSFHPDYSGATVYFPCRNRGLVHLPHSLSYFFPWTLRCLCLVSHRAFPSVPVVLLSSRVDSFHGRKPDTETRSSLSSPCPTPSSFTYP